MKVFICGLYRSGTTVTWRTLAQDERFTSFDEPFNENLADLPQLSHAGDNACYLPRFRENPALFRKIFIPIPPSRDLATDFTAQEEAYLRWLLTPYPAVNVDFTRCTFKLAALRRLYPEALIIHLKRAAPAFVSSHIITSHRAPGVRAALGRLYRRYTFFRRKGRYDFFNYEKIIEKHASAELTYLLPQLKNPAPLSELPAYQKLLLLHRHNQNAVDAFARTHPENFTEWKFEEFAVRPEAHLRIIYEHFGVEMPVFDFSHLRAPNRGYRPDSPLWEEFG